MRVDAGRIVITPGHRGRSFWRSRHCLTAAIGWGWGIRDIRHTGRHCGLWICTRSAYQPSWKTACKPMPGELPDGLKGLIVASPSNPSGTMLSRGAIGDLIAACQRRGIAFISDEIYHGIEYEAKAVSALEISDDVYVINSFSKYYSMTGWGWAGWWCRRIMCAPLNGWRKTCSSVRRMSVKLRRWRQWIARLTLRIFCRFTGITAP